MPGTHSRDASPPARRPLPRTPTEDVSPALPRLRAQAVLQQALSQAGATPDLVTLLSMHGTGAAYGVACAKRCT